MHSLIIWFFCLFFWILANDDPHRLLLFPVQSWMARKINLTILKVKFLKICFTMLLFGAAKCPNGFHVAKFAPILNSEITILEIVLHPPKWFEEILPSLASFLPRSIVLSVGCYFASAGVARNIRYFPPVRQFCLSRDIDSEHYTYIKLHNIFIYYL